MDEKRLYPLSFCTLADEYGWGTDEFLLADLGYRDSLIREGWLAGNAISEIMDTYLDRVVGDNAFSYWGRQFPVQIKRIDVGGTMPLRVHPDTETAEQRYDFLGRRKVWYVLKASPDARLLVGWNHDTDASEVYSACADGSVKGMLKEFAPKAGQFIHIPAGTPHAACGKVELLEVSESSPLDFCLSGLGEDVHPDEFDESLNLVDALDFISYGEFTGNLENPSGTFADYPEFEVRHIDLHSPASVDGSPDSFVIYVCVKGSAVLQLDVLGQKANYALNACKALLVPAECEGFALIPRERGTELLQISVPFQEPRDSYVSGN
ncbi:MAG: hypothetical protein J5737_02075 [Bacteroidales bacterium]|nr:hypothetical protein [Bacteroidales bacterium]